jgi:hypothetical protein
MNKRNQFIQFGLGCLGYNSKQDLIENLYIKSIYDSYNRIDKSIGIENDIRDRFMSDFYNRSPLLSELIQKNILYVSWERWVFKNDTDLGRTDLSFAISGFEYVVECKRLKNANKKYIIEGLHRFINVDYSKNESFAGMIGFIVAGDIKHICEGLKAKCIKERYLNNSFTESRTIYLEHSFVTAHYRTNLDEINIYHLFLKFEKIVN